MSFGSGLGTLIGSGLAASDLEQGQSNAQAIGAGFQGQVAPYNNFGVSALGPASNELNTIGTQAGNVQGYNDFIKNYQTSPAAQYQEQQATEAQNESAASQGGLLSGTNQRALGTINSGIAAQNANTAYNEYLQGNQQGFGQLTSALSGMLGAIGVGTTATGQMAGLDTSQMNANTALAIQQSKNDQSKGSGLGSMFGGLGSLAAAF
jgi:hypothetical protein